MASREDALHNVLRGVESLGVTQTFAVDFVGEYAYVHAFLSLLDITGFFGWYTLHFASREDHLNEISLYWQPWLHFHVTGFSYSFLARCYLESNFPRWWRHIRKHGIRRKKAADVNEKTTSPHTEIYTRTRNSKGARRRHFRALSWRRRLRPLLIGREVIVRDSSVVRRRGQQYRVG